VPGKNDIANRHYHGRFLNSRPAKRKITQDHCVTEIKPDQAGRQAHAKARFGSLSSGERWLGHQLGPSEVYARQ
jgi:hypothetical protein